MSSKRKKYSAQGKVRLLRLHLIEKEPVSDICDRCGLNPNVFYRWQKLFFENGFGGFELIGRVVRMVFGPETGFSGVAFLKLCSLFADTYVIDSGRKVRRRAARRESTAKSVGEVG